MGKTIKIVLILVIAGASPVESAASGFDRIIADYLSVESIKASMTQYVYPEGGGTEVYSGSYFAVSKGYIRIEYVKPENQIVVVNDSGLYWYYPERKLLFLSEKKGPQNGAVQSLMNPVAPGSLKNIEPVYEGMKFVSLFRIAEVYSIRSKGNESRMMLYIDPLTKLVIKKTILDQSGRETVKEEYLDYACINGINIPSRIAISARTINGVVHTVTEYREIVINTPIKKEYFKFVVTPDIKVRPLQ